MACHCHIRRKSTGAAVTAVGTLLAALAVSACGAGGATGTGTAAAAASTRPQAVAFSRCMRSHGVPKFPDPAPGGAGIHIAIGPGSGIDPQSPAFQAAQQACRHLLPGGGPGAGHPTAQARQAMLQTARCMRAHGIPDFPDPTTSPPGRGGTGGPRLVLGRDGLFLALPAGMNPGTPAFRSAAAACHFPVPPTK